jgi:hypothetical protein
LTALLPGKCLAEAAGIFDLAVEFRRLTGESAHLALNVEGLHPPTLLLRKRRVSADAHHEMRQGRLALGRVAKPHFGVRTS